MIRARFWIIPTAVIAAAGVLLRAYRLDTFPGLNPDEVEITLQWFRDPPIFWYVSPSGRPHINPIGPILLWPFVTFASPSPWVVRVPALMAGIALLPITFALIRRSFGWQPAVMTTLLVSSAPILVAYSRIGWDPAYVPSLTALALGLAYSRRLTWTLAILVLLVLVHPTGAFVAPLAAAPFFVDLWRRAPSSKRPIAHRVGLAAVAAAGLCGLVLAYAGTVEGVHVSWQSLPVLESSIAEHLTNTEGTAQFFSGYWQALSGPFVFAGFVGGDVPSPSIWHGAAVGAFGILGAVLLWRQRNFDAVGLVLLVPAMLGAQYLANGPEAALVLRERQFLWAVVPQLLALSLVVRGAFLRLGDDSLAPVLALVLSLFWLVWFYTSYVRSFELTGGVSSALDYRSAQHEPKATVLEVIAAHRRPGSGAIVFVGEARLHIALTYLAMREPGLQVKNLGQVLYRYFQGDDQHLLTNTYERAIASPQDVFFVDYVWDELDGPIQRVQSSAGRSALAVVSPWTAKELQVIRTTDGRPLLKVWRLVR